MKRPITTTKKLLPAILGFVLVAILLTACGQAATRVNPTPTPTATLASGDTAPVVAAAKSMLAGKLEINIDSIQLVNVQPVRWPDTCLGVNHLGIMCAFHVVDGYRVILSAKGQTYEVRSNLDGSQLVLAPSSVSN